MAAGNSRKNKTRSARMGNAIEYKPTRGAIAAAARKLGRHRQSVYRSFVAGEPNVMVVVAEEDLRIKAHREALRRKFENLKHRASNAVQIEI